MKSLLPTGLKRTIRIAQRRWNDWRRGNHRLFAGSGQKLPLHDFHCFILEEQPIRQNVLSENKVHNIRLAAEHIHCIEIKPGQLFSFWHFVGDPSARRGYKKGRTIRNNQLEEVTGGGLCQLSGIIYLLALKAGLQMEERHAHSLDIYREEERFAPLGSDATVAYGYKDLRFKNNTGQSICFCFALEPEKLTAYLRSREPLQLFEPEFIVSQGSLTVTVETRLRNPDGIYQSLHTIDYRKLQEVNL